MARFLADLEGKTAAAYKIHTLAGTMIPVVSEPRQSLRTYTDRARADLIPTGALVARGPRPSVETEAPRPAHGCLV